MQGGNRRSVLSRRVEAVPHRASDRPRRGGFARSSQRASGKRNPAKLYAGKTARMVFAHSESAMIIAYRSTGIAIAVRAANNA